jgi:hypothetical protein
MYRHSILSSNSFQYEFGHDKTRSYSQYRDFSGKRDENVLEELLHDVRKQINGSLALLKVKTK